MKRNLILGFLFVIILSGCTGQTDTNQVESNANTEESIRVPDFQRPEEEANIRGLVKNIIGNEVTILEIVRQDKEENIDADEVNDAPSASLGTTGTRIPGMGGGGGSGSGSTDPDARIEMLKANSIGEKKVLIPVGIKMLKNINGEISEATLLDVTSDKMLTIWTNDSVTDRNVAEFVMIN